MRRKTPLDLDKKDRHLLYLLDVDGRMSYSALAKRTAMSKQLVKYHVERLEKEGYIKGYHPMIDSSRLGFTSFRAYIKFRGMTAESKKEVLDHLKKQKLVWAVVLLAGKWDIGLGIAVKNIYQFYSIWEDLLTKYLKHIKDYKICVYSPVYHYSKSYILDKNEISDVRILGGGEKEEFDDKDVRILIELSKNARIPLLDISKKTGMSPELANHRIKQLKQKKILQGFRAMINVGKLGYHYYKAEIRLADYAKIRQLLEFCHQHPNIYQVDKTIGGETLEVEFHVKSIEQMIEIIENMEKIFGSIESFDYLTVLSEEKMTYMPEFIQI